MIDILYNRMMAVIRYHVITLHMFFPSTAGLPLEDWVWAIQMDLHIFLLIGSLGLLRRYLPSTLPAACVLYWVSGHGAFAHFFKSPFQSGIMIHFLNFHQNFPGVGQPATMGKIRVENNPGKSG